MLELSNELSDFLSTVCEANRDKSTVDGFPASVYKGIRLDQELNMFRLDSGYSIAGGFDGRTETNSYYFIAETFLPVIQQLMRNGQANIGLDGVHVVERNSWDHLYSSPDDDGYASAQNGHINGSLKLEKDVFVEYHLNFTPNGTKRELKSDVGSISNEKIEELILKEIN